MKNHLMLDIETFGSKPDAVVLSIGAVVFDPFCSTDTVDSFKHDNKQRIFYARLDPTDQPFRSIDPEAVIFWMQQPEEARNEILRPGAWKVLTALEAYNSFIKQWKTEVTWANGATFDHVIMQNLHDQNNLRNPVHFKNQICMRTLRRSGLFPFDMEYNIPGLVPHRADDDCIRQILYVQQFYKFMIKNLPNPLV